MSNPIRYDALLVRHLARELDQRFHGERAAAIRLDPDTRRGGLELETGALTFELHPTRGEILSGVAPATRVLPLRRRTVVRAIASPPDERRLVIQLAGAGAGGDRPRELVLELMTNQWNLLVLGDEGRILDVLWRRSAGERDLRPGAIYVPAAAAARQGASSPLALEEWLALLGPVAPAARARRLVEHVAWTSPLNAGAVLGAAGVASADAECAGQELLIEAYPRYLALATTTLPSPVALSTPRGLQPYPFPLQGVPHSPAASLLAAMALAAGGRAAAEPPAPAAGSSPELLQRLKAKIERLQGRRARLGAELAGAAPEAARLRGQADLLLASLHLLKKGMDRVELPAFEGGTAEIQLEPALTPAENAQRLYARASRRERAASRVPALIRQLDEEIAALRHQQEQAERGELDDATLREAAGLPSDATPAPAADRQRILTVSDAPLPYRRYRTSGGLEVRVGRTGRANDELTFHHSSPDDVWLHARDTAGAHVVLRWDRRKENPPPRDLQEAAVLAAVHSRSRTSGVVPVDWTRRKYVRKPRKAPPGRVLVERARTLFVEPDTALEERLRI